MGLTESMTQLCGEILACRGARLTFIADLGQNVAAMKANLRRAHHDMAQQTRAERQDFLKALDREVDKLRAGFRRAHQDMSRKTKAERQAAVNEIKLCVGGICREFALDLAGARRAWSGPSPAERRAQAEKERRAKAEAEERAREAAAREPRTAAAKAKEEPPRRPEGHEAREEGRPGKKKG